MADLDPIPYPDSKLRAILERVRTIAMVGASSNWNRPSYFVMKYLQGKGYRVIPVNPGIAGQTLLGETVYASLRDIPRARSTWSTCSARRREAPAIVEEAIAIGAPVVWMQLGIRNDAAAAKAEAAGHRDHHEPLPEDRIRPARRRIVVERGQQRHHPEPRAAGPAAAPSARATGREPSHNQTYGFETRAIHAGAAPDPTTGARSTPIYQTTSYVFEDVDHAASLFNLHNFGYIYSRLTNPTVSVLEERIASLEGGRAAVAARLGPCRAVPDLLHADGAGRRVPRLAQPLWRLADPVRPVVQEARLEMPFRRPDRPGEFPPGADPEHARRSLSKTSPIPAASSSTSRRSRRSRTRPASR